MSDLFFLFRIEKQTTLRALVSGIVPGIQVIMCVKLEQFNDVQVPHMAKEFAPVLQEKLCYCGYWITFHNIETIHKRSCTVVIDSPPFHSNTNIELRKEKPLWQYTCQNPIYVSF